MELPKSYKEVQKLTGCLVALNHFISKSESGETLQLYLVTADVAVSSVLIREEEGTQRPIYYVSHVLRGTEERYHVIDKAAFAMGVSVRKLKAYFESHPTQVVTDQPLRRVLTSPALSGRLITWVVELSKFELSYIPRISVKAQALADFVIGSTARASPEDLMRQIEEIADPMEFKWSLHVDGAQNDKGEGAGVLIAGPHGVTMEYALQFEFRATNNEAEYEPMIVGLKLVKSLNITEVLVKGDSKLVIDEIQVKCGVKNEMLKR
ncbi:hypothetical protein LIER_19957 [Lithospermum erythrorhizon]|uniref:RNase H type-1 domain-containing protein n=1 Tax=Lithospermum erythrorhizon TaxID=34254 RepID=A0AAV3QM05_LITER